MTTNNEKPNFTYCDENISTEFTCPICHEPFYNPVTHIQCGNTFCKFCVSSLNTCPLCRENINLSNFISTKLVKNIVDALKVKCPQCNTGIIRGEYDNHIQKCPTVCKLGCGKKIAPIDQSNHEKNDCSHFAVECTGKESFCDWKGDRFKLQDHLKECQFQIFAPMVKAFKAQILQQQQQQIDALKNEINTLKIQVNQLSLQNQQVEKNLPESAKNKKWTLIMSSQYPTLQNSYESLVDGDHSMTGAGTTNLPNQYIQATFDLSFIESSVTISSLSPNAPGHWGDAHTNQSILQYSTNNTDWNDVCKVEGVTYGNLWKYNLPLPIAAKYWRLFKSDYAYLAASTLIFE